MLNCNEPVAMNHFASQAQMWVISQIPRPPTPFEKMTIPITCAISLENFFFFQLSKGFLKNKVFVSCAIKSKLIPFSEFLSACGWYRTQNIFLGMGAIDLRTVYRKQRLILSVCYYLAMTLLFNNKTESVLEHECQCPESMSRTHKQLHKYSNLQMSLP